MVPPRGIEPRLQDPQSCVLSVERRGQIKYYLPNLVRALMARDLRREAVLSLR